MGFERIRDQEIPIRLLRHVLRRGRIPSGLLFWGPDGVGKHTTAMEMAKAVNCRHSDEDACDTCLSCRKVDSGNHPDVRVVIPRKKSRNIDVDAVDSLNEMAALRPYEGDWRVFIVQDAERMNLPAQNHFLKTLEEPPGRSMFILLTEFPRMLLPTIRSRCQMVRFRPLNPATVTELLLDRRSIPMEQARSIATLSQGQMSRALDLLDSEKRDIVFSMVEQLASGADPLLLAEEFTRILEAQRKKFEVAVAAEFNVGENEGMTSEDRESAKSEQQALADALYRRDIMEFLYLFETWYRDRLVHGATGGAGPVLNRDCLDRIQPSGESAADKIVALERARRYLDKYISEDRVFRDLFFSLAAP